MELLLSRHARKLLTAHALRDLGRFAAHLDFPLPPWLAREGQRAAKIEDFPYSLKQLHKEFQWPFPPPSHHGNRGESPANSNSTDPPFSPASTIRDHTPKDLPTPTESGDAGNVSEVPRQDSSEGGTDNTPGGSAIKRAHRPPNLDLSPSKSQEPQQQSVTLEPSRPPHPHCSDVDFDPAGSSTPTKHSGSVSEKVSLVLKNNRSELVKVGGG